MVEMTLSIIVVSLPGLKPLTGRGSGSSTSTLEEHHIEQPKASEYNNKASAV
jgi:hypothetical protein